MEQLVARWAHNPKVVGSSPAPATQISQRNFSSGFFHLKPPRCLQFTPFTLKISTKFISG